MLEIAAMHISVQQLSDSIDHTLNGEKISQIKKCKQPSLMGSLLCACDRLAGLLHRSITADGAKYRKMFFKSRENSEKGKF